MSVTPKPLPPGERCWSKAVELEPGACAFSALGDQGIEITLDCLINIRKLECQGEKIGDDDGEDMESQD